jgi:hypothetical protein
MGKRITNISRNEQPGLYAHIEDCAAGLPVLDTLAQPSEKFTFTLTGSWMLRAWLTCVEGEDNPPVDPNDVDVYFAYPSDRTRFLRIVTRQQNSEVVGASANSVKVSVGGTVFDVIHTRYGWARDIVKGHDLGCCAIAALLMGGEVKSVVVTEEFLDTLGDGTIRVQSSRNITGPGDVATTVDRIFKYEGRGFDADWKAWLSVVRSIYGQDRKELPLHVEVDRFGTGNQSR